MFKKNKFFGNIENLEPNISQFVTIFYCVFKPASGAFSRKRISKEVAVSCVNTSSREQILLNVRKINHRAELSGS